MTDIPTVDWTEQDGSNTSAPPDGAPAGMAANASEGVWRAIRGATKRFWNRINGTVTSAGTNTVTLTYTVAPAAYVTGEVYTFKAGGTNTGAATLNVNALGAKAIQYQGAALVGNEIVIGRMAIVVYDGTQFQLINSQSAVVASGTTAGGDLSGTYPNPTVAKFNGSATIPIANGGTGQTTALAAFNAIIATGASIANPGYIKLENGLIFQWGNTAYAGATSVTSNFALAFPSTIFSASGISSDTGTKPITTLSSFSLTQIVFAFDKVSTGNIYYWAVGN